MRKKVLLLILAGLVGILQAGCSDRGGPAAFLFDWSQERQVFVKRWYVLNEHGNIYGKDGQRGE